MKKHGISVTTNIEPETQFMAGMPTSPVVSLARTEVLASPRRAPKTVSLQTEGGVATALSEGFRETVSQLERKFGSKDPFILGMCYELEKEALPSWLTGIVRKITPKSMRPAVPELAAKPIQARAQSFKPAITMKTPILPASRDVWTERDPSIMRLERRRNLVAKPLGPTVLQARLVSNE